MVTIDREQKVKQEKLLRQLAFTITFLMCLLAVRVWMLCWGGGSLGCGQACSTRPISVAADVASSCFPEPLLPAIKNDHMS